MVDFAVPSTVPDKSKATVDIYNSLKYRISGKCGFGNAEVYVVVIAKPTNSLLPLYMPVNGATVEGRVMSVGLIEIKRLSAFADNFGIALSCIAFPLLTPGVWYEYRAKQYDVDFGNGVGQFSNWKSVDKVVVIEGTKDIPCPTFKPAISISGFDNLTSRPSLTTQPGALVPFAGYGNVPLSGTYEINIEGNKIGSGTVANGQVIFNSPQSLSSLIPQIGSGTKTLELTITMGNCTFTSSKTVTLPSIPTVPVCTPPQVLDPLTNTCKTPPTPSELCSQLITTIDTVQHQPEITNFTAPFYVYLRGIKEICKSDPTNPTFIKKLPKGTKGTVTLGSISKDFYLTDDGIADLDLVRDLGFDLSSLSGVAAGAIPQVEVITGAPIGAGERVGNYCELRPMKQTVSSLQFYDVFHTTEGKIYSGNTYDQAKYKAQKDERCFSKAALPCVKITIYHRGTGRNAVIGFDTTYRGGNHATGERAWGWGGYPMISDEDFMRTVAIPQTMKFLQITREDICP